MTKLKANSRGQISSKIDASVPVVILKAYQHGSLGIMRSLGRLGVKVYSIDANPWAPSVYSRYSRGKFIWDLDTASNDATVSYLLEIAQKIGARPILIPTYDEGAVLLADHAKELSEGYIFPQLSPQLVRSLTSKKEMYSLAKKHAIPTPEAYFPQSEDDLEKFLEYAEFPIMLKSVYGNVLEFRRLKKVVATREELLDLYHRCEDPSSPNLMLQEYIPGGDDTVWMFNGYFNEKSECLFGITGRKIRQIPPHAGISSLAICSRNDRISELTTQLMQSTGYRGILDIGYRYDRRDGEYKVLDINPRIGCTFRLFVGDTGSDVARVQYLDLTGQNVPPADMVEGRKWFVEDLDLISSVRSWLEKDLTFRQWMRSYKGVQETAWFAKDDLLPFFIMCRNFLQNAVGWKKGGCRFT
jgi:D-aspartate ligase